MAISRITVFHVQLPLRWSVGHAAARRRSSENVFAVLETSDGTVGFGEGLPRPYVTGETLESCWEALASFDPEPLAEGWPSLQAAEKALEALAAPEAYAPSARSALELAFLDALGRASGRPAAGLVAEALGLKPPRERVVAYSAVLPFARPGLLRALCLGARAWGFPSAKLKVGGSLEEESRRLAAVRGWLGPRLELRADANGAFSPAEVPAALEACGRAGVECLEQPVAPGDWAEMAELIPGPPPVALMADESVCSEEDLSRLLGGGAVQALNCRVAKTGGLLPAVRVGRAALEAGLDVLVGCHVGESTVLSAAGRHLAALLPEARWYEGSYDRLILKDNPAARPLGFGLGGRAALTLSSGLGVDVRLDALRRMSLRSMTLWPPGGSRP